jgi:tetratricopeptide (TPR) repeat protein
MQAAANSFERGLALAPDDAAMLGDTATMLYLLGRSEEAVRLTDRVAQMDPLNTVSWLNKSILLASAAKWDESVSALRTALRLSPDMSDGHYLLALSLLGSGAADEALREIELEPVAERRLLGKAMIYPALGRARLADQALAELIESGASPLGIAEVLATREEIDKSFEWLEEAEEVASPDLAEVHVNPRLVNLRSDPRWERLLERLGKSPATLESVEFELPVQNP